MSYVILGRAVKNEWLALGTIFGTAGLSMLAMSGGKKEAQATKPTTLEQVKDTVKIGASSREEEDLMDSIKQFIADAEKESKH